jgi:hypothetical protein
MLYFVAPRFNKQPLGGDKEFVSAPVMFSVICKIYCWYLSNFEKVLHRHKYAKGQDATALK